jgi:hypothetical protein
VDALYTGWENSSYQIEMQAEPEDQDGVKALRCSSSAS